MTVFSETILMIMIARLGLYLIISLPVSSDYEVSVMNIRIATYLSAISLYSVYGYGSTK